MVPLGARRDAEGYSIPATDKVWVGYEASIVWRSINIRALSKVDTFCW